ncbi:MAG: DUF2304 domain-containing protein [Magnetococcales bacterium]|nr:DUF2304 domain-containing protein [Magnetococcales bacterium]
MMSKQMLLIFLLGLAFFASIIMLVRTYRFREKYSLLWIGISLGFLSIPFLIDYYTALGKFIGIINPISFFFFFGIVTLFLLSVQFTIALTVAFNQRKDIAQKVALLECKILELEKKIQFQASSNSLVTPENQDTKDISKDR